MYPMGRNCDTRFTATDYSDTQLPGNNNNNRSNEEEPVEQFSRTYTKENNSTAILLCPGLPASLRFLLSFMVMRERSSVIAFMSTKNE